MVEPPNGTMEGSAVPDLTNGYMPTMENGQLNGNMDVNGISAASGVPTQQIDFTNTTFPQTIPSMPDTSVNEVQTISADEIALYDRQIRLWGVKAQEKIRSANILLVTIKALGNEIAKNLVLAGVGSLTILDHEVVTEDDLASQFFVSEDNIGQNRAPAASTQIHKLNPRVRLQVDTDDVRIKPPEYFSAFDITIATELDIDTLSTINASCRISNRRFYAAGTHGLYGYVFADLITHDYVIERSKSNVPTPLNHAETLTRTIISSTTKRENGKAIELVTKREIYSPIILANTPPLPSEYTSIRRKRLQVTPLLTCLRALWEFQRISAGRLPSHSHVDLQLFTTLATEKHQELLLPTETLRSDFLRSFLQNLGSEISPVAAFLGGSLAQDVINVLGAREQPLQNLLLFDGEECKGPIYAMHPIFPPELVDVGMPSTAMPMESIPLDGSDMAIAMPLNV